VIVAIDDPETLGDGLQLIAAPVHSLLCRPPDDNRKSRKGRVSEVVLLYYGVKAAL
jgi:hypothetical protein